MNNQLAIIVLIDTEAALAAKSLRGNAYLVDNFRFMGSTGQGTENLTTTVIGNQVVNWLVGGIDLSGTQPTPVLESIGGEAVDKQIMVPQLFDSPALDGSMGLWWGATVDSNVPGKYGYTLHFNIGGSKLVLNSTLDVQTGFTMEVPLSKTVAPRAAAAGLRAKAMANGSILNPDNHVSLFTRNQLGQLQAHLAKLRR